MRTHPRPLRQNSPDEEDAKQIRDSSPAPTANRFAFIHFHGADALRKRARAPRKGPAKGGGQDKGGTWAAVRSGARVGRWIEAPTAGHRHLEICRIKSSRVQAAYPDTRERNRPDIAVKEGQHHLLRPVISMARCEPPHTLDHVHDLSLARAYYLLLKRMFICKCT